MPKTTVSTWKLSEKGDSVFSDKIYPYVMLAVASGLLTLLGSVGIFISLIVQRRLERLQDVLEEFINLSYRSEINLTGKMYNLIEKYQMHYIFPQNPRRMILRYIDLNIIFILVIWVGLLFLYYEPPFSPEIILRSLPLIIGIYATLFFRQLLRSTINLENPLLDSIIPAPTKLRSISFLSRFVNLSVKSVLKQARLTLLVKAGTRDSHKLKVLLKEELSFDDFFYFLLISEGETPCFVSFGEISFHFPPDPVTGKPAPVRRNVNVPLGEFTLSRFPEELKAQFLVFTKGEKHPIQYVYLLSQGTSYLSPNSEPDITVNHQIIYTIKNDMVEILECESKIPHFCELSSFFHLNGERYYLDRLHQGYNQSANLKTSHEEVFID